MTSASPIYALGIDFGTSGARAIAIDTQQHIQATAKISFAASASALAQQWQETLWALLADIPLPIRQRLGAIALNGTSATVLLCDAQGRVIREPLLYNAAQGQAVGSAMAQIAPANHVVQSATSSLSKLLWWCQGNPQQPPAEAQYLLHQADWLSFLLHGRLGVSDYHNALKLGYDVAALAYPNWLTSLPLATLLPDVRAPGSPIAPVLPAIAQRFKLPVACRVCAGTTDSIAAFLASGAQQPGTAVTSIGSTLVLKLLSQRRVEASQYGIYSHRLGDRWLVGGASNTGGAVLAQFFSESQLAQLSQSLQPDRPTHLNYYPLPQPGERFPINDPQLPPRLTPRPPEAAVFLQGLLEGMATIEAQGYARLVSLGASSLKQVYTAGGGAHNQAWTAIRARQLQVPVAPSVQTEAAYGSALLALPNLPTSDGVSRGSDGSADT
ncbi:FGGY-family carbohydrate kinase [Almyronema epifaneia]|uniref:FGGY-family carbohydrate kinase n=1 Tax=Almyronema epifaneia S1 TaxID=2991925 RepID=A0ABW6IGQ5_9CYAN